MGFRENVYKLTWVEGTVYAGLEVVARPPSLDAMLSMADQLDAAQAGNAEAAAELVGMLSAVIVSWNLEDDDGKPVPVTPEGMRSRSMPLLMAIIMNYIGKVSDIAQVPPPLRRRSGSQRAKPGAPQIPQIPMTPMSPESRAS